MTKLRSINLGQPRNDPVVNCGPFPMSGVPCLLLWRSCVSCRFCGTSASPCRYPLNPGVSQMAIDAKAQALVTYRWEFRCLSFELNISQNICFVFHLQNYGVGFLWFILRIKLKKAFSSYWKMNHLIFFRIIVIVSPLCAFSCKINWQAPGKQLQNEWKLICICQQQIQLTNFIFFYIRVTRTRKRQEAVLVTYIVLSEASGAVTCGNLTNKQGKGYQTESPTSRYKSCWEISAQRVAVIKYIVTAAAQMGICQRKRRSISGLTFSISSQTSPDVEQGICLLHLRLTQSQTVNLLQHRTENKHDPDEVGLNPHMFLSK